MHFELALTPAEVRRYDWQLQIDEEAAVNKELKKLLEQAPDIRAAVKFTNELTNALKRPGKDAATPAGAAKRVAKTVMDAPQIATAMSRQSF